MNLTHKMISYLCSIIERFVRSIILRISLLANRGRFKSCGKNVTFNPVNSDLYYSHISVGDDVYIGDHASFIASIADIKIGNHVLFGPHVTIRGGDHRFDIPGRFIKSITDKEKKPDNDRNVIIEDDVWIGTNATILKGVTVGRGSIVAAGALVIKNIPPYTIWGGVPAKMIKTRFSSLSDVALHEKSLFSDNPIPINILTEYYK